MKFDPEFIEKVRDANNIVDIISEFAQLKGSGGRLMGLCPFPNHREKTPSFSVSSDKQVYYCFGCKKAGNIFTFLEEMKGLNFPEAVEYLAQRAAISLPAPSHSGGKLPHYSSSDRSQKQVMWKINQFAAQFYHRQLMQLKSDHPMRAYCRHRGLSEETLQRFQIGAAFDEWEALVLQLEKSKAPIPVAEKLGLVRKRPQGSKGYYDLFRGRLMFPIYSQAGNCLGFGGRVVGEAQPKYLNSHDSEVFNKGKTFYGFNETAKFIREADEVILVEGYMDLIALYQAGITNVVATLGTALTPDHARLLARHTKNVLVLFDGDSAGWTAAERSLPLLLTEGLIPRHFAIPGNKDPDDFLKENGADVFRRSLQEAPELFHTVLHRNFMNYHGQPGEKLFIIDTMQPVLNAMKDARLRELYIEELADRLQVEPAWLKEALHKPIKASASPKPPQREEPKAQKLTASVPSAVISGEAKIVVKRPPRAELYLLNLALMREDHMKALMEAGLVDQFQHAELKEIFKRAIDAYRQMPSEFDKLTALLTSQVDPPAVVSLHLDKTWGEMDMEGEKKLVTDCTRKVREAFLRARAREQLAGLRSQPPSEQLKKLEQIVNIHANRRNLQKDFE